MPAARAKTVFDIPYEKLFQSGFRGLIFDIDQTLVMHGYPVTPEIIDLFAELNGLGFTVFFLSNNSDQRISEFVRDIDGDYIPLANKPHPHNYRQALEAMSLDARDVLMIGDQLFTDVLGASRAGISSVLVDFLYDPAEGGIGKKRQVERLILGAYPSLRQRNGRLEELIKERRNGFLE